MGVHVAAFAMEAGCSPAQVTEIADPHSDGGSQLVELLILAGWYRAISYVCNAAKVPLEDWAARWPR
ncbi:MAG: hypothetical protein H7255_01325 [Ramlibacter sp.]|nr:hypothetical protein [Ramlibacter sp.]